MQPKIKEKLPRRIALFLTQYVFGFFIMIIFSIIYWTGYLFTREHVDNESAIFREFGRTAFWCFLRIFGTILIVASLVAFVYSVYTN